MRAVSKVITLTARESGLVWTGNLVAASRVKATEPQTLLHIVGAARQLGGDTPDSGVSFLGWRVMSA